MFTSPDRITSYYNRPVENFTQETKIKKNSESKNIFLIQKIYTKNIILQKNSNSVIGPFFDLTVVNKIEHKKTHAMIPHQSLNWYSIIFMRL